MSGSRRRISSAARRRVSRHNIRPDLSVSCAPSRTFSPTVSSGTRLISCGAIAIEAACASAGEAKRTILPLLRSSPRSGASRPQNKFMSVDLPAPFSPMMAWTSPARIPILTSDSARTGPKLRDTPAASKTKSPTAAAICHLGKRAEGAPGRPVAKPLSAEQILG